MSKISVQVVYALPERQYLITMDVAPGSTIEKVIVLSGLLEVCRDIDLKNNRVGIYSRLARLMDPVNDGDRIEIYRPLTTDPKELRRQRAEQAKNRDKQ